MSADDPLLKAVVHGVLHTGTRSAFDQVLADAGFKIVPVADDPPPPGVEIMHWGTWQHTIVDLERPGWSVAKFPLRTTTDKAGFVTGITWDMFGIYKVIGNLTNVLPSGALDLTQDALIYQLVHLRSGVHLAAFVDMDEAVMGAELASKVPEWRTLERQGTARWHDAAAKTQEYMLLCGLVIDEAFRALFAGHDHPVIHRIAEVVEIGRPEKLS